MVLCKFFQQGTCRYGTKCHNEHFDIKQIIKTDMESAINGKQWPMSCYGPFKDKSCVPNFIEDQSFEEIRWLCYDAKQKNYFEQFHQQFTKEVMDTTNKMKALLQMNAEAMQIVTELYDTPIKNDAVVISNNPFSFSGNTQSNSIFKNANTTLKQSSIFGGNSMNTTQSAGNSIFGGGTSFGMNSAPQTNSIFAQQTAQQKTTNSIFGGNQNTSVFGQPQNASMTAQTNTNNPFAQATQTNNSNLFAQKPQPMQSQSFGLFSQAAQQTANTFNQTNLFNQAAATAAAATPMQQQTNNTSIFGQATTQSGGSIFGQNTQTSTANTLNNGFFSNATSTAQTQGFATQMTQSNLFTQQTQPTAAFFQNTMQQAMTQPNTAMQTQQMVQQQQHQQQQQQQQTPFGQQLNNQMPAVAVQATTLYSTLDSLTPEELAAFKADMFTPGCLPCAPPPKELC